MKGRPWRPFRYTRFISIAEQASLIGAEVIEVDNFYARLAHFYTVYELREFKPEQRNLYLLLLWLKL